MSRPQTIFATLSLCLLLFLASGCLGLFPGLKGGKQPIEYILIEYPRPEPSAPKPLADGVLIRRLTASALFSTDRIIMEDKAFEAAFYYYNRWAVNPAPMLSDFMYRDVSASGLFAAVLNGPGFLRPAYELSGTLETFKAEQRNGEWQTRLEITILLFPYSRDGKSAVADKIFQKRYAVTSPCENDIPTSIAGSLSAGSERFSKELIADLKQYLEQSPQAPSGNPGALP